MVEIAKSPVSIGEAAKRGIGIYSATEAACYAKMPRATLASWFFDQGKNAKYRQSQIDDERFKAIGFLDFVEALAIRTLRNNYGVSFQKIRQANDFAKNVFGTEYPFAHEHHETRISNKEIFILDKRNPDALTQISGKRQGQTEFTTVVETWMRQLEFGDDDLANLFIAKQDADGGRIIMDPRRNFGTPTHEGSGYPAEVLWEAAIVEGSIEDAAREYGVDSAAVDLSYRYCSDDLNLKFAA